MSIQRSDVFVGLRPQVQGYVYTLVMVSLTNGELQEGAEEKLNAILPFPSWKKLINRVLLKN